MLRYVGVALVAAAFALSAQNALAQFADKSSVDRRASLHPPKLNTRILEPTLEIAAASRDEAQVKAASRCVATHVELERLGAAAIQ